MDGTPISLGDAHTSDDNLDDQDDTDQDTDLVAIADQLIEQHFRILRQRRRSLHQDRQYLRSTCCPHRRARNVTGRIPFCEAASLANVHLHRRDTALNMSRLQNHRDGLHKNASRNTPTYYSRIM